jgi:hypothetical protein
MTHPKHGGRLQAGRHRSNSPALSPYLIEDVAMTADEWQVARAIGPEIVRTH